MIIFSATAIYSPGPNNLLCLTQGAQAGFRRTLPLICGIAFGFFLAALAACLLNLSLVKLLPALKKLLPPVGCAYMLWLAYKVAFGKTGSAARTDVPGFKAGVLLQAVNVKALLNVFTIIGVYVTPWHQDLPWLLICSLLLVSMSCSSCMLWALGGAGLKRLLAAYDRSFRIAMGLTLTWCAYSALSNLWR